MQVREMLPGNSRSRKNASAMSRLANSSAELSDEFKSFVSDVEGMIKKSASLEGKELDKARKELEERVSKAKGIVEDTSSSIARQARENFYQANDYVRSHPWSAAGVTLALGVVCGLLLYRRK
ncbi:DUF883 family protein [Marinimicrobium sp. C2-29]|uniref:DUF883 family protein n=1 Tax=Marinimicrobium sp. C2-29 TaxID=3139825 RepID=UPI003139085A